MAARIAFVLKGYPRLSETFIAQEIHGLEQAGLALDIYALRRPTDRQQHPVHAEIRAPARYLPEYLHDEPLRVLRAWRAVRRRREYPFARSLFLADLRRDFTRNRVRRFGQALVLAAELGPGFTGIHAHFIHTPASVARYASYLTGLPWTCSAHAKDVFTTPDWELQEKLADARWVVTCTRLGLDKLRALAADPSRVYLSYHGLDLGRFGAPDGKRPARDGSDAEDPVRLLCVGRAVEKKGLDLLLDALARLPPALNWRLKHVGGGPLLPALAARARTLEIDSRIEWLGAQPQDIVLGLYREADLFVLPCRVARDGDRDGLPNVLVEAASQELACISTAVAGVTELLVDGDNALIVAPEDVRGLARAIERAIVDAPLRRSLGMRAARRVREGFSHRASIADLMRLFLGTRERAPAPLAD